jgi:hypothetical protein
MFRLVIASVALIIASASVAAGQPDQPRRQTENVRR